MVQISRSIGAWFTYGLSEGRTIHLTDRKQDLRSAWSTVWKATQKVPREEFPMYFFMFYSFILTHFFYILPFYFYIFCIL